MLFSINKNYYKKKGKRMNKILFFLIFTMHNSALYSMHFDYQALAPELQCLVLSFAATQAKKPREATRIINALALTNKQFNADINDQKFGDNLIKKFSEKYCCSHETIAKQLHTKQAKERLALQYKLKSLCCHQQNNRLCLNIDKLISQGVDLEFTYNHCGQQKTPLIIAISNNNDVLFQYLLTLGVNINGCNAHGITALHLACIQPDVHYATQLITHPEIAINQLNKRHENALLYCLIHRKTRVKPSFVNLCAELINAGSDPECTNKQGQTPLKVSEDLRRNNAIIQLLNNAIQQKARI